jgi:hypothetical protein
MAASHTGFSNCTVLPRPLNQPGENAGIKFGLNRQNPSFKSSFYIHRFKFTRSGS